MFSPPSVAHGGITEQRLHLKIKGTVQGVGFRPYVYGLANDIGLVGWVLNNGAGVELEVQGTPIMLAQFQARLKAETPPLAHIEHTYSEARSLSMQEQRFSIRASDQGSIETGVSADAAVCDDCLAELFNPADRRYRYGLINCTNCGPRYTITAGLPYDRINTSMAAFGLCNPCQYEYTRPEDRRFHAQANACRDCGPQLAFVNADGDAESVSDVIATALQRLQQGAILAIKGLGGFHLVCDARNAATVDNLRQRKGRDQKPFAVMVANCASLANLADCSAAQQTLLESIQRPIVLMRKKARCDRQFAGVAPRLTWLGAMLPYTPLHYLLFHEAAGRPKGVDWLHQPQHLALVMTSANPGGEPLVTDNNEAMQRLAGIADGFVLHDRDIRVRCDDSVVRCDHDTTRFIRRGRGYTPQAIQLAKTGPAVLAFGAWYKNTICLTRGDQAFVSQHVGDLDNRTTCVALEETVEHLTKILEITPQRIAHDLHPDFYSSRLAAAFAQRHDLPAIAVQHHHAHIASVMAEHRLHEPVLGLALDGVGLGSDGGIWGGELLHVHRDGFERLGCLQPLALPGGDRAAREPWRMAASALHALNRGDEICKRFANADMLQRMLDASINCPTTSSAGRLFDAAAGLLDVQHYMAFEGEAAMVLESLALNNGPVKADLRGYNINNQGQLSFLPLLDHLADCKDAAFGAALFHATLAQGFTQWLTQAARHTSINKVVLGGGCMLNGVLTTNMNRLLHDAGLQPYQACQLPPNDGGLSLGQAWVALMREE